MTAKTCFKCNHPLNLADNFCPSCGKAIRGRKTTDQVSESLTATRNVSKPQTATFKPGQTPLNRRTRFA